MDFIVLHNVPLGLSIPTHLIAFSYLEVAMLTPRRRAAECQTTVRRFLILPRIDLAGSGRVMVMLSIWIYYFCKYQM